MLLLLVLRFEVVDVIGEFGDLLWDASVLLHVVLHAVEVAIAI